VISLDISAGFGQILKRKLHYHSVFLSFKPQRCKTFGGKISGKAEKYQEKRKNIRKSGKISGKAEK